MNKLSVFAAVVSLVMTTSVSAQQKLLLGQSYIDFTIKQLSQRLGRIKLNAVYMSKFGQYNEVDAFGFYISIPLGQWTQ